MSTSATLPASTDDTVPSWARQVLQRQMDMLGELAEVGLQMAKATGRQVAARAEEDPSGAQGPEDNLAMAYARVARAVRLTLMLQARVVDDIRALDLGEQKRAAKDREAQAQSDPEYQHRARVERIVQRVAMDACGDDEDEVDRLVSEASERLDDDDIWRDILTHPVGELVAGVCRDLGLDPDWTRLAQEAWAVEEIASGAAGSPFLAAKANTRPPPPAEAGLRAGVERAFRPPSLPDLHARSP